MALWKVKKYRKESGECPFDDWLESRDLTKRDRVAVRARLDQIECIEGVDKIPGDWVVGYGDTGLHRIKKRGQNRKALRVLCKRIDAEQTLVMFNGEVKKDDLSPKIVREALDLEREWQQGKGSVEDYD
jgi:hypothetical protein